MSLVVHLDTALLAIPNYATDQDSVEQIIFRLKHWADCLVRFGGRRIVRRGDAEIILGGLGFFPIIENVKQLLELVGLNGVYDAGDVWRAYNTILNRAGIVEEAVGLEVNQAVCEVEPDVFSGCSPADLRASSEAGISTVVVSNVLREIAASAFAHALATSEACLQVRTRIVSVRGPDASIVGKLPPEFVGTVQLLDRLDDAVGRIDATDLWRYADDESALHFAITMRALEIERAGGGSLALWDVPMFSIGSAFFQSVRKADCGRNGTYAGVALDACARLVLDDPKYELKEFGRPSQKMRSRDKALAYRTHVTKGGVGLRLMCWKRGTQLELANIGPKFEEYIDEGVSGGEYKIVGA